MMTIFKCYSKLKNIVFITIIITFGIYKNVNSTKTYHHNQNHLNKHKNNLHNNQIYNLKYQDSRSRFYLHGGQINNRRGGTCAEFKRLNNMNSCCHPRNDECYMIHYDSRCYCDTFCSISVNKNVTDCCPDAVKPNGVCSSFIDLSSIVSKSCIHKGHSYKDGAKLKDNCNECECVKGSIRCTNNNCLIDINLLEKVNTNQQIGWKAENYSQFFGKTLDFGYHHKLGVKLTHKKQRDIFVFHQSSLPHYDFRTELYFSNKIKDQEMCGASWAYSIAGILQDRLSKVSNKKITIGPSVEMLISCFDQNKDGCTPISVDKAWKFIENYQGSPLFKGIIDEECYPEDLSRKKTGHSIRCKIVVNDMKCIDSSRTINDTKNYRVSSVYPISMKDIEDEIYRNGPVQMVFKVFNDFFMYKSGIYRKHPDAVLHNIKDPYHAVKVLGWGKQNGVDFWIAENSWGPDWGENGYFKIDKKDMETEIGLHTFAAWASDDLL